MARRKRQSSIVGIGKQPFPDRLFTRFSYVTRTSLTTVANNSAVEESYRMNSLFDPEVTIGGGQPRYFDTLCGANNTSAPYSEYIVMGAKIQVKFNVEGNTNAFNNATVGIRFRQSTITASSGLTYENMSTLPDVIMKNINGKSTAAQWTGRVVSGYRKMVNYVNNKNIRDNEEMTASSAANPITQIFADVFLISSPNAVDPISVLTDVKITYYAMLFNKNLPELS